MKISKLIPILLFLTFMPLHAQKSGEEIDRQRTKVEEAFIHDVVILSTAVIERSEDIPKHILIRGYTMPSNYFLMRFPVDDWNTKLFMNGCGLGCGTLPADISGKLKKALQRGYATATMNSGHWGSSNRDLTWAYNNPQAEKDYAYRALHETVRATKELIKVFYNQEPLLSYFWGCSGGGRQGIMEAARYPEDFDGIISEAPALNFSGWAVLAAWLRQANTGVDGKDILAKEDLSKIKKAVYDACDKVDGKVDGLVSDPSNCAFDPEVLICEDKTNCLSREKIEVLKKWYEGPINKSGEKLLPTGLSLGSEPLWGFWFLGESTEPFDEFTPWNEIFQYLIFKEDPGASYSVLDFDFDADPERLEFMGSLLNVNHLSMQSFKDKGGKLLLYHGLADPMIPYQSSVDYYKKNYEAYGHETMDFFRLFLIPGMDHCTAFSNLGITDNSVDPLTALEAWVEKKVRLKNCQSCGIKTMERWIRNLVCHFIK
ncbi:tannase/feruloyl esterase family alpha/beta hydrolase [Pricia sp. S334]|uniref:Tannase/feruloyl esterase family alpha/beta hydrolase n=1 Tax=Pricia mediterranea TaxID=3076079 RepID=A0ABU3L381_9FLAO|nr:tannase/feruloyl esterase family alpha/beta hydrolase [Pricia sp. S334]MDT7828215.1 tannase/feruloyl esterase family alpha/beta hydrolase [Pricia sp. S334]